MAVILALSIWLWLDLSYSALTLLNTLDYDVIVSFIILPLNSILTSALNS